MFKWSSLGNAVLIVGCQSPAAVVVRQQSIIACAAMERDRTGDSYYGESNLHLMLADGSQAWTVPFGACHVTEAN